MESENLIATAEISIDAPTAKVWNALVNPEIITQYMFGTTVTSDWVKGGAISWKGEWQGKAYEDKGTLLNILPGERLQYSHYSPVSGEEDTPRNYHTVTIDLFKQNGETLVRLTQDKNADEDARLHSEQNWKMMLEGMKKLLEASE